MLYIKEKREQVEENMIVLIFLLTGAFSSIVDACFSANFKGLQFDLEFGNASSGRLVFSVI